MTNVEIAIDLFAKAIAFYYRAYGKDCELCVSEIRKRLDFLCLYDSDIEKAKNKAKEILGI